ncbi:MAG: 30S ribosomal protein S1, partial [Cyanobacteria bacterium J06623_1]
DLDAERGRISLSTKQLEPEPGDMLKNREIVFEKAEEMAEKYRQKLLAEAEGISVEDLPPAVEEAVEPAVEAVDEAAEVVQDTVEEAADAVSEVVETVSDVVEEAVEATADVVEDIVETVTGSADSESEDSYEEMVGAANEE